MPENPESLKTFGELYDLIQKSDGHIILTVSKIDDDECVVDAFCSPNLTRKNCIDIAKNYAEMVKTGHLNPWQDSRNN